MQSNNKKRFTDLCIIVTITLLLFILINFVSFLAIQIRNSISEKMPMKIIYGTNLEQIVDSAYPDLNFSDVLKIYENIDGMEMELEPFTMFTEQKGYESKYVNISKDGFRLIKNQKSLKTNAKKVFVFGSSPVFGYNVRDQDTVASHLQEELGDNYSVFNFGRGYYYSHQQLSLLIRLVLEKKLIPDHVIFINNHANERGLVGPALENGFHNFTKNTRKFIYVRDYLPVIKILQYIDREYININSSQSLGSEIPYLEDIDYFLRTNEAAKNFSDNYNIKFNAIYPPAYGYKYKNFNNDPLTRKGSKYMKRDVSLFSSIEQKFQQNEMPSYFYNFMYLHNNVSRPYVDTAHFSSDLSREIAKNIRNSVFKDLK